MKSFKFSFYASLLLIVLLSFSTSSTRSCVSAFTLPLLMADVSSTQTQTSSDSEASVRYLYDPAERQAHYNNDADIAQYLVDLHDHQATFDFCGGMMFQLELTPALRDHLVHVAAINSASSGSGSSGSSNSGTCSEQPVVFDAGKPRMFMTDNYQQTSNADNLGVFHGREIRQVPTAAGGMGMVLQLSLATGTGTQDSTSTNTNTNADTNADKEGWTSAELARYDGWGHDSGREWRKGNQLEEEGFTNFRQKYGPNAFSLHHRFFLHYDRANRIWLSAEDGCEGTPAPSQKPSLSNLFGLL
ncbi:expressed unknown protein [Seminavis robusta]|uniref:Uncharacterized protein n=1 Tax=Seminavis robusta TaxID=568900 RepID=A0A9N8ELI6_9STRA|nr:expressed unknown protein [Seminavis robusta]|eukprot:Sro1354_g265430.1 n/a (301) ;mRNA; r:14924-15826